MLSLFLVTIAISLVVSLLLTFFTYKFYNHKGWVENPKLKNQKTGNATALYPVPRGGGIPITLTVLLVAFLFLNPTSRILAILFSLVFTLFIGVADDFFDLNPRLRLFTNALAALIIIASGVGVAYITNPLLPSTTIDLSWLQLGFSFLGHNYNLWILSDTLAFIWIIWCLNIVGWSAGVEGQLPGYVAVSSFFIGVLAMRFSSDPNQVPVIVLSAALTGASLGFLKFNFFPQKIMIGYSGKSTTGLLLAVLAILAGAKVATLILLLALPMLDAIWTIIRRLKEGKPIYQGDGKHLHHHLLKLGYTRRQIAVFYWCVSLIAGLLAISLNSTQKLFALIGLSLAFIGLLLSLHRKTLS